MLAPIWRRGPEVSDDPPWYDFSCCCPATRLPDGDLLVGIRDLTLDNTLDTLLPGGADIKWYNGGADT